MTLFSQYSFAYVSDFNFNFNTGTGTSAVMNLGRAFPIGTLSVVSFNLIQGGTCALYVGGELYKQSGLTSLNGFGFSSLPLSLHFVSTIAYADFFYWTAGAATNILLIGRMAIYEPKTSAA